MSNIAIIAPTFDCPDIPDSLRRTPDNQVPRSAQGPSFEAAPTNVKEAATLQLPREVEKQVARVPQPTPTFDYTGLAKATADDLRDRATRLRGFITKSTTDMIAIGYILLEIKAQLDHGQFTTWVENEIPIKIRLAQDYMRFAIGHRKNATIALLPPSTVRILTAKSAPPEIVERVLESASAGNIVSDTTLKEVFSEDRLQKKNATRDAVKNVPKGKKPKDPGEVAAADRRLLQQQEEEAKTIAAAQSIFAYFSEADVLFLAQTLNHSVFCEFERLVKERLVEVGDR
jgi:hypothetical protein